MSNSPHHISPPKLPLKLLKLFLKKDYLEEIEGDMEEVFQDNLNQYFEKKARRKYLQDTLKLIRPSLLKNLLGTQNLTQYDMFKNNIKIGFRILKRDKVFSFINIIGLSTGLAISLLILLYVKYELGYENYNSQADRMVRVTLDLLNGETLIDQDCETYPPLGSRMKSDFSEVTDFVRTYHIDETKIIVGDDYYNESKMYAVDPSFFKLFNYPLIHGNANTIFKAPHEVVLTETQAIKYFNKTDVVGKSIWVASVEKTFEVTGVIVDSPTNTHLKFDMLISFASMKASFGEKDNNWSGNNTYTYLQLASPNHYQDFTASLSKFNEVLHKEDKLENERLIAQPISDIHLYSNRSFEAEKNGDATSVFFLLGVGILVILIAIVNYINLATSKSLDRAKEVGIRKVVGSSLAQLRVQFFTESFLINLFAGVLAILMMVVALGKFKSMANLPVSFSFIDDSLFWYSLVGVIVLSTFLSGIFPAFILSSFQPVSMMRGKFTNSSKGSFLRKSLVVFQFSITIFLLVQTLTTREQLNYMREKDLGVNVKKTVVVTTPLMKEVNEEHLLFKKQLFANSQFQSVALSSSVPGLATAELSTTTGVNIVDALEKVNFNFYIYHVDTDFVPTMEMSLAAGDNFLPDSKNENQILVNEKALKVWGIPSVEEAIGKKVNLWGRHRSIKGVIKDFHQTGAKSDHIPMLFVCKNIYGKYASIRLNSNDVKSQLADIETIYEASFPNNPFEFFFLDQEYDKQYRADEQFQQVFTTLTGFAIMIACLGLFGLTSFMVAKRTKEIGVRKVLGASIVQLIGLLSKDFILLIVFSMLISIPVTYILIEKWLEGYAFRIDMSVWLFLIPAIAVLLVSCLTIFTKTFQISNANPVNSLRDE